MLLFQSTLPRRERRINQSHIIPSYRFNPRSHEGSDRRVERVRYTKQWFQSTLPRRERHMALSLDDIIAFVSIHAPTKGATISNTYGYNPYVRFNPRSHEGSDETSFRTPISKRGVSIHAPTKGATCSTCPANNSRRFQSTLPRRERPWYSSTIPRYGRFQSTLPRRERLACSLHNDMDSSVSIHAPTKGAT